MQPHPLLTNGRANPPVPILVAQTPIDSGAMPEAMPDGMSGAMPMSHAPLMAGGIVLGAVVLVAGTAVLTKVVVMRSLRAAPRETPSATAHQVTHPPNPNLDLAMESGAGEAALGRRSRPVVKIFSALGLFVALSGGIVAAALLLKPPSLMADMDGMAMEGMSMEDMMRVDGATNPVPVTVEAIEPGLLEASVRYTGSTRPYQEVTVYPRVEGLLTAYTLYPGDPVTAGQVLARLRWPNGRRMCRRWWPKPAFLRLSCRSLGLKFSNSSGKWSGWPLSTTLVKELPRAQALVDRGAISQSDFDRRDSELKAAQAALNSAQTKLARMGAQVEVAAAKVAQTQVRRDRTAILADYTTITAPITGTIQARMVDPGVFVQPGMAILKIGDYSRVRLQANVAQADALNIRVGSPMVARLPGSGAETISGQVTSIFPQAGETTRTVMVEAVVDNPGQRLGAGQFLEMTLITARKPEALSVPQTALRVVGEDTSVWVMAAGVAQRQLVTTGLTNGDRVEVTSGLNPGDLVITTGGSQLVENARVVAVDGAGNTIAGLGDASQGNVQVQLISPANPVTQGDNQLILQAQDAATGAPLPVSDLAVTASMAMPNMAPMQTEVKITPGDRPGQFQVNTDFTMAGPWQITARVDDGEYQGQTTFTLDAQ